jgi:hypothetical protein
MDDLIAFLNARLDEDEAAAKQAAGGACPFDLWRWLRPRLLAERSVRIVERRKCEWCGRIRPLGKFWQPVACRYIWVCRECSGSGA